MKYVTRILLLFLFASLPLQQESNAATIKHKDLLALNIKQLSALSEKYLKYDKKDSATGCNLIIISRYGKGLSKEDKKRCIRAYDEVGVAYYEKNNYAKALDFLTTGLKLCEEEGFFSMLPPFYNNIGRVYSAINDFKISINAFEKGLELSRRYKDKNTEKKLLFNLACHCSHENIKDKATFYNAELKKKFGKEDPSVGFYLYLNNSWMAYKDGNFAKAEAFLHKTLGYAHKHKLPAAHEAVIYETLGAVYANMPTMRDSAYHYLLECEMFTRRHNLLSNLRNTLLLISDCYKEDGNDKKALAYRIQYWQLSDSLLDTSHFSEAKNNHFLYEMEQDYEKIKRLQADAQERERKMKAFRIQLVLALAGVVLFSALTGLNIYQKRKLRKTYKYLFERNAQLLQAETQESKPLPQKQADEKANQSITSPDARKSEDQREQLMAKLKEVMDNSAEIYDCNFSIIRLAELVGSNQHDLSIFINRTYDKNFRTFINEYRMKEAQRRLIDTKTYGKWTIKAIAESVGYKSQSSFITLFKKSTGITPSIFQQLAIEKQGENRS